MYENVYAVSDDIPYARLKTVKFLVLSQLWPNVIRAIKLTGNYTTLWVTNQLKKNVQLPF